MAIADTLAAIRARFPEYTGLTDEQLEQMFLAIYECHASGSALVVGGKRDRGIAESKPRAEG